MQLQLGNVFAGLAVRPRKPQRQRFVDDFARRRIAHPGERGLARGGQAADQRLSASPARGPEMRTTAIAAGGRPEERAKMVSSALTRRFEADPARPVKPKETPSSIEGLGRLRACYHRRIAKLHSVVRFKGAGRVRRREFISLIGGAAAMPLAARAQERVRRVGVLMLTAADEPELQARIAAFQQGLQEAGWAVGRNMRIDTRWARGDIERMRRDAAELVALGAGRHPWLVSARPTRRCNG